MRKNTPMLTDPSRMLDLSNYLYAAAAFLTLLATFGVIYYGRVVSNVKDAQVKQYQKDADARIAASNQRAAEANALAKSDELKIKELERDIALANSSAKNAEAQVAGANKVAEQARANAFDAQARVEQYKAPRVLDAQQRSRILSSLQAVKGQPVIFYVYGDDESLEFAVGISQILAEAGWTLTEPDTFVTRGNTGITTSTGVSVQLPVNHRPESERFAQILSKALNDNGVPCQLSSMPSNARTQPEIHLIIGKKPL